MSIPPKWVARIFPVSKSTLFRWEREGLLPKVKRARTGRSSERMYGLAQLQALSRLTDTTIPEQPYLLTLTVFTDEAGVRTIMDIAHRRGLVLTEKATEIK